jgi:hypothetical protein
VSELEEAAIVARHRRVGEFECCGRGSIGPFWIIPDHQSMVFDLLGDQMEQIVRDNTYLSLLPCSFSRGRCAWNSAENDDPRTQKGNAAKVSGLSLIMVSTRDNGQFGFRHAVHQAMLGADPS